MDRINKKLLINKTSKTFFGKLIESSIERKLTPINEYIMNTELSKLLYFNEKQRVKKLKILLKAEGIDYSDIDFDTMKHIYPCNFKPLYTI